MTNRVCQYRNQIISKFFPGAEGAAGKNGGEIYLQGVEKWGMMGTGKGATANLLDQGGEKMSVSEIILLLNFIAVVVFGILNLTTKKK